MSSLALKPLSLAELDTLEAQRGQRHELWDGQPIAMTGGTRAHNLIALGLRDVLRRQLPRHCDVFVADMAVRFPSRDQAYPDVMVVCEAQQGAYQEQPILLAEVLSDSSVARDRGPKFNAYRSLPSVEVYLIISQTAVEIEVYRRAENWTEELYRGSDAVVQLPKPALSIPLRDVYAPVWEEIFGVQR